MPNLTSHSRIVIAGAGSIGCYVGGCLALAGRDVAFLARSKLADLVRDGGLRVTDLDRRDRSLDVAQLKVEIDPRTALSGAQLVIVCVKSGATAEMAALIDKFAPQDAVILSLQNGTENAARIRKAMNTPRKVLSGMVPFNVVLSGAAPLSVHRATEGEICIEAGVARLTALLSSEGLPVRESDEIASILWGKLLLNLNNALNALSDRPLVEELSDRGWRKLLAAQMEEALTAMRALGLQPAKLAAVSPSLLPKILRLPNWLFTRLARRMLAIDPEARSSMWDDLTQRRLTEIDELQGAVLRLAAAAGSQAPVNARVLDEVRKAEAAGKGPPGIDPASLAG